MAAIEPVVLDTSNEVELELSRISHILIEKGFVARFGISLASKLPVLMHGTTVEISKPGKLCFYGNKERVTSFSTHERVRVSVKSSVLASHPPETIPTGHAVRPTADSLFARATNEKLRRRLNFDFLFVAICCFRRVLKHHCA